MGRKGGKKHKTTKSQAPFISSKKSNGAAPNILQASKTLSEAITMARGKKKK